jgi:hypothetical protein
MREWIRLIESLDLESAFDDAETPVDIAQIIEQSGARQVVFRNINAPPVYVLDDQLVVWDGKDMYPSVENVYTWISDANLELYFPGWETRWNEQFWRHPALLYHATTTEKAATIQIEGIQPRNETRGIANRSVGAAIFTTVNYDAAHDGSYGDVVFEIDTRALAKAQRHPYAAQEPPVVEYELRNALAHKLEIDYEADIESGMSEDTVILYGAIPPEFFTRVSD